MKVFCKSFFVLLPVIAVLCMTGGCHKEQFTTKGALSFTTDTLTFDTVFTTLGSTTQVFKVLNKQNKDINISDIRLLQLSGTQFRMNVDGLSGTEFKNTIVPAHDSLYVFVEVTINPTTANNPFVIFDKIQFVTNGITQDVVLEAMGQNAYYYFSYQVTQGHPFTFPTDKPNIIVNKNGGLPIFAVDSNAVCTIPPGCRIYMGPNAVLTVDGTLNAMATSWSDSIIFQYIRSDYQNLPGQWLGITYSRIATINMSHVVIDQSTFGVSDEYVLDLLAQAQITTSNINSYSNSQLPTIKLNQTIIKNCSSTAVTALCANFAANNCLFTASGGSMVVLGFGGNDSLNSCTLSNVYNAYTSHQSPSLTITDAVDNLSNSLLPALTTTVNVINTAVVGTLMNELAVAPQQPSLTVAFQYCALTTNVDSFHMVQPNDNHCIYNPNIATLFINPPSYNYMPDSTASPLTDSGSTTLLKDLYDYTRPATPSIGAIEWHQ